MIDPLTDNMRAQGATPDPTDGEGAVYPLQWAGCAAVYQAIARALTEDAHSRRMVQQTTARRSVVYQPFRRELALRRLGLPPLFFPRQVMDTQPDRTNVRLYLDVSGSMTSNSILHFLFGLLLHLNGQLTPPFYHFTTTVRPVSAEQIAHGVLVSGGTDIDCVIAHALHQHFPRILVISDGDFGEIDATLLADATQRGLTACYLLTTPTPIPATAATLGPAWHIHEELAQLDQVQINAAHRGPRGKACNQDTEDCHPIPWFTVEGC